MTTFWSAVIYVEPKKTTFELYIYTNYQIPKRFFMPLIFADRVTVLSINIDKSFLIEVSTPNIAVGKKN